MYLALPTVQSEVLNYNDSLCSAFKALHIHDRLQIFIANMVKTGIPMSVVILALTKNEDTKSQTVN